MSRIFIGPCEIAGYYLNLTKGLKALGEACDYVTFTTNPYMYGGKMPGHGLVGLIKWINKTLAARQAKPLIFRMLLATLTKFLVAIYFCVCLVRYDVFIFGFGRSIFQNNMDIPILKFFGKKIIMNMAHGSELRPPYINGAHQAREGSMPPTVSLFQSLSFSYRQKNIFLEKYADYMIGAPFSSAHFSSAKFINTFSIGLPYEGPPPIASVNDDHAANVIRILHSPSHPAAKGSLLIREAIERLRGKGYNIDFRELRNRSNAEVLEEIQQCDFVVDQVYSDTPLAGFATEAAWFAKPAVVGGYGFEYLKQFVPQGMFPPSQICHPDHIESAIEELILNPDLRYKMGAEAQAFVRTQWSIEKVAMRFLRLVKGDIPDDWWLDPQEVIYMHGAGQHEAQTKENIRKMVEAYGVTSLQLSHRPDLEKAFLEFAGLDLIN